MTGSCTTISSLGMTTVNFLAASVGLETFVVREAKALLPREVPIDNEEDEEPFRVPSATVIIELVIFGLALMAALLKVAFPIVFGFTLLIPAGKDLRAELDTIHFLLSILYVIVAAVTSINTVVLVCNRFRGDFVEDSAPFHRFQVVNTFAVHVEVLIFVSYLNLAQSGPALLENSLMVLLVIDVALYILFLFLELILGIVRGRIQGSQETLMVEV